MDEVVLDVLTRRDVRYSIGIFFRQVGQNLHLLGVKTAERDFDPRHAGSVPHSFRSFGQTIRG